MTRLVEVLRASFKTDDLVQYSISEGESIQSLKNHGLQLLIGSAGRKRNPQRMDTTRFKRPSYER